MKPTIIISIYYIKHSLFLAMKNYAHLKKDSSLTLVPVIGIYFINKSNPLQFLECVVFLSPTQTASSLR